MDLLPTPEQDQIVASIRAVIADHHTLGHPMSDGLWTTAVDQGWFGLGVTEASGGVGYGLIEEALLCVELGRGCVPGPLLGTILAAMVSDPALRAEIIGGRRRVALAEREGDGFRVFDGEPAGLALRLDDMIVGEVGALRDEPCLDPLMSFGTTAEWRDVDQAGDRLRATLLLAAALAGMAAATTAQSVDYGTDREQFGQPIGGFQAVKHRCADMAVRSEAALTQVYYAAISAHSGRVDAAFQIEAAAVVAARAAVDNAEINIQNHGGIGFTLEHTAHRYVTRARVLSAIGGGPRTHRADLLRQPA